MSQTTQCDIHQSLSDFMKMAPNFDGQTRQEIESFFAWCMEGMDTDSEKLLATLFIKALNKKINSESIGENIYLGKYEISQIQLFDILIDKFPFVKYSQHITNSAIVEEMRGSREVTIMDIGIGLGTQVLNIIEKAKSLDGLEKLHVVGIEPFGDALAKAETTILGSNGKVPFEITFTGIHDSVEKVDFSTIPMLGGKFIVNASLALHHIQTEQQRREIIAKIKSLNPSAFVLIEPNVNHYETDFYRRFKNCYNHFYSIFQVIDRIENISNNDKNALKLFFGREIEDIIGKEDKDRFEKHEPATHWIGRLKESNFSIKNDFLQSPVEAGCGVEIAYHKEGFLGFTHGEETVLAVIYAN
ncbi:MAG: GRAS family protein [Saprospiraceae bacterium]